MEDNPIFQDVFEMLGLGGFQQNLEETRKLTKDEKQYLQWLYKSDRARYSKGLQHLDTVEYYLRIILFPVVLIIRRDIPSLCDYLRERVSVKMEALRPKWVGTPYFIQQEEKCERLWRFWQSQFALDAANGGKNHPEKVFLKLIGA